MIDLRKWEIGRLFRKGGRLIRDRKIERCPECGKPGVHDYQHFVHVLDATEPSKTQGMGSEYRPFGDATLRAVEACRLQPHRSRP